MREVSESGAWLEQTTGQRVQLGSGCSIGRAATNQLILSDERVSRRHTIVHAQGEGEFWLVDLGSSNGTYLNGRRVAQPVRLRSGDQIGIGPFMLTFRQTQAAATLVGATVDAERTLAEVRSFDCWLLLADLESSTELSQRVAPQELPMVMGRWLAACQQVLDGSGGRVDKFLGDGFLAYWPQEGTAVPALAAALQKLKQNQQPPHLPFRFVVHHGRVFSGGATASGVERLFGPEVNFIFRLERLASTLGLPRLLSSAAHERLQTLLTAREAGRHRLDGFEGQFLVLTF